MTALDPPPTRAEARPVSPHARVENDRRGAPARDRAEASPRSPRTWAHGPHGEGHPGTHDPARPADGGPRHAPTRNVQFGRFRLIERIGRGCQGQVWKALQVEPVVETIALKLLAPDLAREPDRLAQFHREAEVGARLSSPWLLPSYEFGTIQGVVYMTMPLVNGRTLAEVIEQLRRPGAPSLPSPWNWWTLLSEHAYIRAMSRVISRVAQALEVAHRHRVAHRDIKPANILIDCDREDRVYLCDFGLSLDLDVPEPSPSRGSTGTPLYMAPEKLVGDRIDETRCDIYALGVTLFEALTRAHPFHVPEDLPKSHWGSFLYTATPRQPRSVNPHIPASIEAVILKAMERCPARRHASAAEFGRDIERALAAPRGN